MSEGNWTAMLPVELTYAEHDAMETIFMCLGPHDYTGVPISVEPISLQELLETSEEGIAPEFDTQALDALIGRGFVARSGEDIVTGEDKFVVTERGRLWWKYRELVHADEEELPRGLLGIVTSLKLAELKYLRDQIEDILAQEDDEEEDV